jgi:hypothetical protein
MPELPKNCTQLQSARSGRYLAHVGKARRCYARSKNICPVGSTITLSVFIAVLDYPANNVSVSLSAMDYLITSLEIFDAPIRFSA